MTTVVIVNPSYNDLGNGVSGAGSKLSEQNVAAMHGALQGWDYVISGLALSYSGLVVTAATGIAMISGFRVNTNSALTLTLTASATNWIYLKLVKDGSGNVSDAVLGATTGATPSGAPPDSVLLGSATMGAASLSSSLDQRPYLEALESHALAWVVFSCTVTPVLTVLDSWNVSSVTRTSGGVYAVTLALPQTTGANTGKTKLVSISGADDVGGSQYPFVMVTSPDGTATKTVKTASVVSGSNTITPSDLSIPISVAWFGTAVRNT